VWLEGDSNRFGLLLSGPADNLLKHMAVCAMYTVEIADADDRRSKIGGDFGEFMKYLHQKLTAKSAKQAQRTQSGPRALFKSQSPVSCHRRTSAR
jgi:hypothetical protein